MLIVIFKQERNTLWEMNVPDNTLAADAVGAPSVATYIHQFYAHQPDFQLPAPDILCLRTWLEGSLYLCLGWPEVLRNYYPLGCVSKYLSFLASWLG